MILKVIPVVNGNIILDRESLVVKKHTTPCVFLLKLFPSQRSFLRQLKKDKRCG